MRKNIEKLNFNISKEEHIYLKTDSKKLKKKQLQDELRKSLQQSKEGKIKSRGSFAKYIEDTI